MVNAPMIFGYLIDMKVKDNEHIMEIKLWLS